MNTILHPKQYMDTLVDCESKKVFFNYRTVVTIKVIDIITSQLIVFGFIVPTIYTRNQETVTNGRKYTFYKFPSLRPRSKFFRILPIYTLYSIMI